jgi:GTP pyrophosphokinase
VTRGKGVSIHRDDCRNFQSLVARNGERVIEVRWGIQKPGETLLYPVEVSIEASDRQGLLRDISEVFAKEKMNVVGVQSQSVKGTAWMTFTVEVSDASLLKKVLQTVKSVVGVGRVRRN